METIGAYEAKTHLPKLLERVSKGEHITISRHGVPIAILQPYDERKNINIQSTIAELRQFRKGKKLSGLAIRNMIEEGRR
ncbi:MAG: type II toxin-antitoxin system prevent-host-death family antitoxin [Anaerolineales bacterium]|nr:type II toxin-antitoxin system prevent-host-death family antitoxin [Anaerolineales bacterium]